MVNINILMIEFFFLNLTKKIPYQNKNSIRVKLQYSNSCSD